MNILNRCIRDEINCVLKIPSRQRLRSSKSSDLFVPRTRTVGGTLCFDVAGDGLKSCNNLPALVQERHGFVTCKRLLKNHLFA